MAKKVRTGSLFKRMSKEDYLALRAQQAENLAIAHEHSFSKPWSWLTHIRNTRFQRHSDAPVTVHINLSTFVVNEQPEYVE